MNQSTKLEEKKRILSMKFISATFTFLFFIIVLPSVSASSVFLDANPSFYFLGICLALGLILLFLVKKDNKAGIFSSLCFILAGLVSWQIDYGLTSKVLSEILSTIIILFGVYVGLEYGLGEDKK